MDYIDLIVTVITILYVIVETLQIRVERDPNGSQSATDNMK